MSRRRKEFVLDELDVAKILSLLSPAFPEGAEVTSVYAKPECLSIGVLVSHDSFPACALGTMPERVDVKIYGNDLTEKPNSYYP